MTTIFLLLGLLVPTTQNAHAEKSDRYFDYSCDYRISENDEWWFEINGDMSIEKASSP